MKFTLEKQTYKNAPYWHITCEYESNGNTKSREVSGATFSEILRIAEAWRVELDPDCKIPL